MIYAFALLIGIVVGLRTMTAPAAASWAARLGKADLAGGWLAFLGSAWAPWLLTLLAVGEFVADQLPATPSRKVPVQFAARLVSGALSGAVLSSRGGSMLFGAIAGIGGAVIGTLGGAELRARMAKKFGRDRPAAIIEDLAAVGAAAIIVALLP